MGRYQRSSRPPPIQSGGRKETIKYCVLTSLAVIFLYRMQTNLNNDNEDLLLSTRHDDVEYRSIRKAVPQDYDQPEKSMGDYSVGRHREEKSRTKLVELLLLAAEPRQIFDHAHELLPPWVKLYFGWYRQQPVDSNQLVVNDLRYLDAAVYAAAQMNRLLKLDLDETTMVGASSTLDWTVPTMADRRRMRTLDAWDDRDTADDAIVFGSTEFLQSVAVTTTRDALSPSLFGPLWHSVFQPSPLLLQKIRTNLDQNAITASRFAAVHCHAGFPNSVDAAPGDNVADTLLLLKAKRAIQCGQWALEQAHQDFVDIFFISSNEHLNDLVRSQGGDMLVSPTGLERIIVPEPAHPARNGRKSLPHDDWWVDLYTAIVARCMVYGEGDFGEIASKVANTDCQVRHEETKVGTAPMCPAEF
jgi:hypothetical protein